MRNRMYPWKRWLLISIFIIGLDQVTKYWAVSSLPVLHQVYVMPYMNWNLIFNHGAAFGFLSDQSGWQSHFFLIIAVFVSLFLLILVLTRQIDRWGTDACFMIISGGLGNAIDRIRWHGAVIDFIQLHIHHLVWPSFNVADSAITVGAVLLFVYNQWGTKHVRYQKE